MAGRDLFHCRVHHDRRGEQMNWWYLCGIWIVSGVVATVYFGWKHGRILVGDFALCVPFAPIAVIGMMIDLTEEAFERLPAVLDIEIWRRK
jgi:hypothetical protein